ncbi:MAG: DUF3558 domain-containing protein [Labedaea sp.]
MLALAGLLAVAGCTRSEAGEPAPPPGATSVGTSGQSPNSSSGRPSSSVQIPPRPKELRLDGLDPCALFTEPQRDQLKANRVRNSTNKSQQYNGMPECILSVQRQPPYYEFAVTLVTNEGIGPWLGGKRNVEARLASVETYPAATYWFRGANGHNTPDCSTSVDVAEGQQLMVNTDNDGNHTFTLDELCQRAEQAAGLAVQTLRTLK